MALLFLTYIVTKLAQTSRKSSVDRARTLYKNVNSALNCFEVSLIASRSIVRNSYGNVTRNFIERARQTS